MTVTMKITKEKGEKVTATDKVTLTNLAPTSIFSQVDATLNGVLVNSGVGNLYCYTNYFEMLLMESKAMRKTMGLERGYYMDSTGGVNTMDPTMA